MKRIVQLSSLMVLMMVMAACGSSEGSSSGEVNGDNEKAEHSSTSSSNEPLTIVWYPNESGADLKDARDEIGRMVEEAVGRTVEHQTTTDYIIAIEALVNGNADLAFMGAQGYIEANLKNEEIQPLVVPSGASGTLDDAVYYSWIATKKGNEGEYQEGSEYSIDRIVDKKFSFVSNSSTSGFKVPAEGIISHFSELSEFTDLTEDDLIEGGQFFSEVLFGGSHQGAAVNLLTDKADVAAFCDTCVGNYVEISEGEENTPGAIYHVKEDAAEPFQAIPGEEFVLLSVTPVLNAPFVVNEGTVSDEEQNKLIEAFESEEMANNETIFVPSDSEQSGLFTKSEDERFLRVEDAWFNPIRELSK